MKFGLFVIGAFIALNRADVADAASSNVRGVPKDDNIEQPRELKKNGGGGNQSGNGSTTGGEGVATECPYFMKGWPSGVKNCQAEGNAGCAAPCGGSTSSTCCCVASNGDNYCGNPTDCNEWTTCVGGGGPVASSATNALGGDVVDIKAGDGIDIQVYTNSEGNEVVQIYSSNKVADESSEQQKEEKKPASSYTTYEMKASDSVEKKSVVVDGYELSSVQVASETTAADCNDDEIFVKLELLVDDEFEDYGSLLLGDDDDDSTYWNEDKDDFDSGDIGDTFIYSECLKRDNCYYFSMYGGNRRAFTWGYAKFNVDYRNGSKKRLLCLGSTIDCQATYNIERVTFGCDCNPSNVAYADAYTGGCTNEELERAAEDSDDDDSGD